MMVWPATTASPIWKHHSALVSSSSASSSSFSAWAASISGEGLHILESGAVALGEPGLKLQLTGFLFVQLLLDFIVVFHDFFLRFK